MTRHSLHLGLFVTLAAAAYACGSDSEDDSNSSGSPGSSTTSTNATSANASTSSATSGSGGSGGTSATGGTGGVDECGGIGSPCSGTCPNSLVCYQSGTSPFCVPAQPPECGGFAGAMCPARAPNCLYLQGADFGPCFTNEVKDCVCLNAPGAVTGC